MNEVIGYEVSDGIAILGINNPPVNAVGASVRQGLSNALHRALGDDAVQAILILGEGRTFPAGSDIREFGKPPADPWLPGLCNAVEASPKIVVAALHGTALGGGFELALATHYRVAAEGARIGFPEVTLGILPGAGGTQRAPRLAGAGDALDLMLSGRAISVTSAEAAPYIDKVVQGDLRQQALSYVQELLAQGAGTRPTRDIRKGFADPIAYQKAVALRKEVVAKRPEIAPQEIVKCVEAAELLPFDMGLTVERAAFDDCVQSDQAASLRHVFFAERRAPKFPEISGQGASPVSQVGIVGGGVAGRGLALACLEVDLEVVLIERNSAALRESLGKINAYLDRLVAQGRLRGQARDDRGMRLHGKTDFVALSEADVVIEAVADDLKEKQQVFFQLDAVVREGAVLVSTTMRHDLHQIAGKTGDPGWVLGLDIGTPAHLQQVAEVMVPEGVEPAAVAALVALLRRLGKLPVRAEGRRAHIGRAVLGAYRHAADMLVEDGSTPYLVDEAMRAFGMKFGPFEQIDREGLREDRTLRRALADNGTLQGRQVSILDRLCEAGRFGRSVGQGYYLYDGQSPSGRADPEVIALIREERESRGIAARGFSEEEIQRHCLAAMVNEGARLLRLGVARCPSDIDVVMVHGYGFPRWRGGPMKAADLVGLWAVQRDIEQFAQQDSVFWSPEPVFDTLFKAGQGFDALNG
ncbi:MAG: 3-hydroxyacyl-CoA dehydrogenase [Rhodobacteraceae bacterium]|nr:3-hydroxyacyl-CoA dehydrogenase [Paracoccaceae bacterium]